MTGLTVVKECNPSLSRQRVKQNHFAVILFSYIVVHRLYTVTLRIGGVFQWSKLSCYSACICNTLKVALSDRSKLRLVGVVFFFLPMLQTDERTRQNRRGGETYLAYGSVGVGATWVQIHSRSALPVAHVLIQSIVVLLFCCQRRIPTPPLSHRSFNESFKTNSERV